MGKITRHDNEIATVPALNATVRPAVCSDRPTATAGETPRCISSR